LQFFWGKGEKEEGAGREGKDAAYCDPACYGKEGRKKKETLRFKDRKKRGKEEALELFCAFWEGKKEGGGQNSVDPWEGSYETVRYVYSKGGGGGGGDGRERWEGGRTL